MDEAHRADLRSGASSAPGAANLKERRAEQEELERRERALVAALADDPLNHWGLVPAHPEMLSFVTSLFLHAGWVHLLGSLLVLYLIGPFVETVWQRPLYLLLFLASGVAACIAWVLSRPGSTIPLIGASGALSGIMGAFLLRYWRSNVHFFYSLFFIWKGTFAVPGWIFLPLWFIQQVYFASLTPVEAGGVGFAAHAAGFGFGVIAALVHQATGFQRRYVPPHIESHPRGAVPVKPAIERAREARAAGERSHAVRILKDEVQRKPQSKELLLTLWDSAVDAGRADQAASAMEQVIRMDLAEGDTSSAAQHWLELEPLAPQTRLGAAAFLKIGQSLREGGHPEVAKRALGRALAAMAPAPDPLVTYAIARAALGLDPELARTAARQALSVPGLGRQDQDVARRIAGEGENEPPPVFNK